MPTSDVPTEETLAFVLGNVPEAPARLLEVGCGDGALASRLQERGHQVIALDADPKAIAKAKARGVDARVARWPEFADEPFDAVLFTQSLHHINPLDEAVERAKQLLRPGGKGIVEDFAFDEIEPAFAEWLYQTLSLLDVCGALRGDAKGFAARLLRQGGGVDAWRTHHDHGLHTAGAMRSSLRRLFPAVQTATAPYLYRYVSGALPADAAGARIVSRVLELERRFAEAGGATLVGRRFVAAAEG